MAGINEIGSNLTGGQIQNILDHLLYSALEPIITHTEFLDEVLPAILVNIIKDKRRKISTLPFEVSVTMLSNCLLLKNDDRVEIFDTIRNLKIERNLWSNQIKKFLQQRKHYMSIVGFPMTRKSVREKRRIERMCKLQDGDLFVLFNRVHSYYAYYNEFRKKIITQYINMAYQYANLYSRDASQSINPDDLAQSLLAATAKALDKYDSGKGALTSYIKYWLFNAKTSMGSTFTDTNIAFDVPTALRTKIAKGETGVMNFAISLSHIPDSLDLPEVETPEQMMARITERERILRIIKAGDVHGIYRLTHQIDEIFSEEEYRMMGIKEG